MSSLLFAAEVKGKTTHHIAFFEIRLRAVLLDESGWLQSLQVCQVFAFASRFEQE